jgi:hypothetical protein
MTRWSRHQEAVMAESTGGDTEGVDHSDTLVSDVGKWELSREVERIAFTAEYQQELVDLIQRRLEKISRSRLEAILESQARYRLEQQRWLGERRRVTERLAWLGLVATFGVLVTLLIIGGFLVVKGFAWSGLVLAVSTGLLAVVSWIPTRRASGSIRVVDGQGIQATDEQ